MSTYSPNIPDPGKNPRKEKIVRFLYNLIWVLLILCMVYGVCFALGYGPAIFLMMISSAALLFTFMIFIIVYNSK